MSPRSRLSRVAIVVLWPVLLVGCAFQPKLSSVGPEGRLVAFGDSLTYGTGTLRGESYPGYLEEMIGREVINSGVPGELAADGLRRLPEVLDQYAPSVLLLCHGGNDLLTGRDARSISEDLRKMVRLALRRDIEVVLIGVPQPGFFLKEAGFYRQLSREMSVPCLKGALTKILSDPSLKFDRIHPNSEGYRVLAEKIAGLLVECGAIEKSPR